MANITDWNGGTPSKSTVKNYVHDAKELEFSLYTLQQTRERLRSKLGSVKKEDPLEKVRRPKYEPEQRPEKNLASFRSVSSSEETAFVAKYRNEHAREYWGKGRTIGYPFLVMFALCLIGIIAGIISGSQTVGGIFIIAAYIIGPILFFVLPKIANKKNDANDAEAEMLYRQEIDQYNINIRRKNDEEERRYKAACAIADSDNIKIRERNEQRRKDYESACTDARAAHNRKIQLLQTQLDDLDGAIARMERQRKEFYSANIVPVDYRTLGCVFFLDHSFRNDLVDTVRQGIDRYELSEYRNAVIQGLGSIAANLNNLTGLMQDLGQKLNSIQSQVSFMSNDLYNMAERQSQAQEEANRQILEETRLRRYATEELNMNAERIIKYCDTGRTY